MNENRWWLFDLLASTNGSWASNSFDAVGPEIMVSWVRALINASHSESTMRVEREFASKVGTPLFVGLAALVVVFFSFTYTDHVTKKTTGPGNILRIGMGLVSIYGAYDFGFGHYKTYDERLSRQVRYSIIQSNVKARHEFLHRLL
jgi:hypothetical protein